MFSATVRITLIAITCIISFWIVLYTYLLISFSDLHTSSPLLSSYRRMQSWVKLESSPLPWPLEGRACLAKNFTFEKIFSRFCRFTDFVSLNAVDNWAKISPQAHGIINKRLRASLWVSGRKCLSVSVFCPSTLPISEAIWDECFVSIFTCDEIHSSCIYASRTKSCIFSCIVV